MTAELQPEALIRLLEDARARTLALVMDLEGSQLFGPRLPIVNPPLWEVGHVGWFQERWCLRRHADAALAPSILSGADALYDSSSVAHAVRWDLPLPTLDATLRYLDTVFSRVCERIAEDAGDVAYFAQLAALHEEMHAEAFTYTRQTLGYRAPRCSPSALHADRTGTASRDVVICGGEFMLGASPEDGFVFDNEKWAHPVCVQSFSISQTVVTNSEFGQFVDDGGYTRRELWNAEGWQWRESAGALHPVYWQPSSEGWLERRFDELMPLEGDLPVMHVNWYEADAYCRWAGRRLPTEAEWEYAAATAPDAAGKTRFPWGAAAPDSTRANLYGTAGGRVDARAFAAGDSAWSCRQMIGNVWEWTADNFGAYPGFVADPYADYSQPWFGNHKVLRGGSFATRAALVRNTWRNFYTPDRRDVFAGFRTCAA